MALTDAERINAARNFVQRNFVERNELANLNTEDIKAAATAIDTWIDANQTSFNAALPNPFRTTATLEQKIALFKFVLDRRVGD